MRHYSKFFIGGEWVEAIGTGRFELVNPATETVFATVSLGAAADVDRAVDAARSAFPVFSATSKEERLDLLRAIVARLEAREKDVADAITEEMGAPVSLKGQTGTALAAFRQAIVTLGGYDFETMMGDDIIRREAIGVCGLITAWNWPIQQLSSAFAAGYAVVVKPSEYTPLSTLVLAEILHEAGVPAGVLNVVVGDGPTVGNAISAHIDIDMASFTGSTRAVVLVAEAAAPTVKRVSQELGASPPTFCCATPTSPPLPAGTSPAAS